MITCFDLPEREENFISACARLASDMLFLSRDVALDYLFGIKQVRIAVDLPSYLNAFIEALPPNHYLTVDRLIDEHSALPFYSPFLPLTRVTCLRESMANNSGRGLHARAGIVATVVPAPTHMRYCSYCIDVDRQRLGFCYWHRVHQLPGIYVCPDHAVWLEASEIPMWGRSYRESLVTAECAVERRSPRLLDSTNVDEQIHLWVAHNAAFLLTHQQSPSADDVRQRYLYLLAEQGFATYRGTVHTAALLKAFQRSYTHKLLSTWNLTIDLGNTKNWLARLVRSSHHTQHPICHLLLMHFLNITPEQFFAVSSETTPFGKPLWPCLNPVCSQYRNLCISTCRIDYRLDSGGKPIGIFACDCGFVYTRTGPDTTPDDRWRKTRIEIYGPIWDRALQSAWNDPDKSIPDIARQFQTDPATIKRNAARLGLSFERDYGTVAPLEDSAPSGPTSGTPSDKERLEEHKDVWLGAVQANPNVGMRGLAKIHPQAYAALYRHDPLWLREHTPRKPVGGIDLRDRVSPVDWEKRDRVLAKLVRRAAKRVKQQLGQPVRVTRNHLANVLRIRGLLQNQLRRMPQTTEALAEVIESSQEFAVRRIWYAAEQMRCKEVTPTRAKLLDVANAWPYKDLLDVRQAIAAVLQIPASLMNSIDEASTLSDRG